MLSILKRLLEFSRDFRARQRIAGNAAVSIAPDTQISAYRRLSLRPGCRLEIGAQSLLHCTIITEHPEAHITIGARTFIGSSKLISAKRIIIGDDILISWGCTIVDHNSHSVSWSKRANDVLDWARGEKDWTHVPRGTIHIQNKAWIGADVTILKNVTIGEGAVVGASSVVTKDVPAWTIVAGNPAKVIRVIPEDER